MFYYRKLLQNETLRQQIAQELEGRTWTMAIKTVAPAYVFFEHPDFPDHVFCSNSIITSRPLTVGLEMNVQVEIVYDEARKSYSYVAKSAIRPQDNINTKQHKSEYENLASTIQKLLAKAAAAKDETAWRRQLPTGWNWSREFVQENRGDLQLLTRMLNQCGAISRLHGTLKADTVDGIREIFERNFQQLRPLSAIFEKCLHQI